MKLKKVIKSKRFWKTEMWIGGFLLGIPFFVSGKSLLEYISSLTFSNIVIVITCTALLGLFIESYFRPVLRSYRIIF